MVDSAVASYKRKQHKTQLLIDDILKKCIHNTLSSIKKLKSDWDNLTH